MAQSGGKRRRRGISNKIGENEIYTGDWVEFEFGRGEFELPTSEKRGEEKRCFAILMKKRRGGRRRWEKMAISNFASREAGLPHLILEKKTFWHDASTVCGMLSHF